MTMPTSTLARTVPVAREKGSGIYGKPEIFFAGFAGRDLAPDNAPPLPLQYPSIIRANNLCYSTLVLDPRYDAVDGVDYYTVATGMGVYRFAQAPQGVVPALLEDLAQFRKKAKKDMAAAKAAGDSWAEALFNSKQLAYKITMNSVYGFCGATKGMLPCVPIAASVTATGRAMIQQTKELAERLVPGSRVIYGVSRGTRRGRRGRPGWVVRIRIRRRVRRIRTVSW